MREQSDADVDRSLCTSLSHVLLASTIEFDNEFELRLHKTWARPFLTSIVAWGHVMQHVSEDGTTVEALADLSGLSSPALTSFLGALERWNYVRVQEDPTVPEPPHRAGYGTARGIRPTSVIRPSITGEMAQRQWAPLGDELEGRWRARFGDLPVDRLAAALRTIRDASDRALPRLLPVLNTKGLFAEPAVGTRTRDDTADRREGLPVLLSQVLLAYTLEYEADAGVALPIAANLLRVLTPEPVAVGDLPIRAGISKEAVAISATWLENAGLIAREASAGGRGKVMALTPTGAAAQSAHASRLLDVEGRWNQRLGTGTMDDLRSALEAVLASPALHECLTTPPGGWRGKGRYAKSTARFVEDPRRALPRAPVVLHRGGWPDGS